MNRLFAARSIGLILVVLLAAVPATSGADRRWNALSGSWGIAGNWNPAALPGPADTAIVDYFNGSPGLATVSSNVGSVGTIHVQNGNTVRVSTQGVLGVGTELFVGYQNTGGTLTITGSQFSPFPGQLNVAGQLRLGVASGTGVVNHNMGTVTVGGAVDIGTGQQAGSSFPGVGTYNLNGGVLNARVVNVGDLANSEIVFGTLNVSGGAINAEALYVAKPAFGGSGLVNQTGGRVSLGTLHLYESPFSGTYNLSGGTLLADDFTGLSAGSVINYTGGVFDAGNFIADGQLLMSAGGGKSLRVDSFDVTPDGVIDLNDNALIQDSPFQFDIDRLKFFVASSYANGAWNGASLIRSSAAAANAATPGATKTALGLAYGYETAIDAYGGQSIGDFGLFVRYTIYGDADLDATVDIADFARVAANFQLTQQHWGRGDFNFDEKVNLADFAALAANFNRSLPAEAPLAAGAVPEPTTPTLLLVAAVTALARRAEPGGRD